MYTPHQYRVPQFRVLTVAIGERYVALMDHLVASVVKFTNMDVIAYVDIDDPAIPAIVNKYNGRLVCKDYSDLTDTLKFPDGSFNYNIKNLAISREMLIGNDENALLYMDADAWLFGWDYVAARQMNPDGNFKVLARMRSPISTPEYGYASNKLESLGLNFDFFENIPTPIEHVMFFVGINMFNGMKFAQELESISRRAIECCDRAFPECVELSYAMKMSECEREHLGMERYPFLDSFRILHQDKIHIPFNY